MGSMNDTIRTAAEIAQQIAEDGGDAWEIIRELMNAADEIEFGWTGSRHIGTILEDLR